MKYAIFFVFALSMLNGCIPPCSRMVDRSCRYKNPEEFRPVHYECECWKIVDDESVEDKN